MPPANLNSYLYDLYMQAGQPSLRRMAAHAHVSHVCIADMLRKPDRTKLMTVRSIVRFLDGDPDMAQKLWMEARETRPGRGPERWLRIAALPTVFMVVSADAASASVVVGDRVTADGYARAHCGVLVNLPVLADYRTAQKDQ